MKCMWSQFIQYSHMRMINNELLLLQITILCKYLLYIPLQVMKMNLNAYMYIGDMILNVIISQLLQTLINN